jgi:hypothetical protein
MAKNAARPLDRKRGSEDTPEKGHGFVQPVAHRKDATSEKVLTVIDNPHEDSWRVQPVAQRSGVESFTELVALACAGNQDSSARAFISGLRDC